MTRSIRGTRRAAVLLAGAAAATALLVTGCGTGQIAETALKPSGIAGLNIDSPDGSIQLRNLRVPYKGTKGYAAGGNAPVSVVIHNATGTPISVRITTVPPSDPGSRDDVVSGRSVVLRGRETTSPGASPSPTASVTAIPSGTSTVSPSGSASPSGTPSASPSATGRPERPAVITVPAGGFVTFPADSREPIEVTGLDKDLVPGKSLNLLFEFERDGKRQEIRAAAPMNLPLSPAPRGSKGHEDIQGGH